MAEHEQSDGEDGDRRRVYYDHEPAWRAIAEADGRGWDDLPDTCRPQCDDVVDGDSYRALERFLNSRWAPHEWAAQQGARAVDLGCGGGQSTIRLAELGYEVVGVDFSETAIELARENAEQAGVDCEFVVGDVVDLDDFETDSFDLVVDNHCLHCLIEPEHRRAFLDTAERLLRPAGVYFSETMSRDGSFDPEKFDIDPHTWISRSHTRIMKSKIELDEELREAGFNVIHTYSHRDGDDSGYTFVNYALSR
ncbi:MAG: class I SAM-dependent methyltransferase [Persicimonas sp.]